MRGLESLTPNGSEFVGEVERCVQFVRDGRESTMRVLRQWKAELEQVKAALRKIRDYAECGCEDHSDPDCCNHADYHCPFCIAEAALGEKGSE